jgi:hypothetical protein
MMPLASLLQEMHQIIKRRPSGKTSPVGLDMILKCSSCVTPKLSDFAFWNLPPCATSHEELGRSSNCFWSLSYVTVGTFRTASNIVLANVPGAPGAAHTAKGTRKANAKTTTAERRLRLPIGFAPLDFEPRRLAEMPDKRKQKTQFSTGDGGQTIRPSTDLMTF